MMAWFRRRLNNSRDERYASSEEFQQLFETDEAGFFELAYALTADCNLARECLVSGLQDCRNTNAVFREWARKWARRVIVRNAVRLLRQRSRNENSAAEQPAAIDSSAGLLAAPPLLHRILALPDFERVVCVLSAGEHYSNKEIALLLERSPEEIREAGTRALQQVAEAETERDPVHGRSPHTFLVSPESFVPRFLQTQKQATGAGRV